jgi:hypothetical protein
MRKIFLLGLFMICFAVSQSQQVQVEYNFNNVGDCTFGAHNNLSTPVYLQMWFTSLENSTFREDLPYIKKLEPGYNSLFTLARESEEEGIRFIYDIKVYRSFPGPKVDLGFPYLVPFVPGSEVKPVEIKNIDGFWGQEVPKAWRATGFYAKPGTPVFASRQGQVMEIAGDKRTSNSQTWYNTWNNAVTLLQPDGTLITYKNVVVKNNEITLNQKVQPGEMIGEVAQGEEEIVLVVYHYLLNSTELQFIIPSFLTAPGKTEIVNPAQTIKVIHPDEVRGLEMTRKEQRQYFKK